MLKLKPEVVGAITVPILDENNQETRIALNEHTTQENLAKVFALDGCKHYFVEEPSADAPAESIQEVTPVVAPIGEVNDGLTSAEADEAGAGKKKVKNG